MTFDEMKAGLQARLEALPPAARAELLHLLRLPDFDRADAIGTFWGHPKTREFGELLIDLEEAGATAKRKPHNGEPLRGFRVNRMLIGTGRSTFRAASGSPDRTGPGRTRGTP